MANALSLSQQCEQELHRIVDEIAPRLIELRRSLHQRPELSEKEFYTTELLLNELHALGFDARTTPERRGVICDFDAARSNIAQPMTSIRGDIDALPLHDEKHVPYRSIVDGAMHACGHDVHASIVFGVMATLRELERCQAIDFPVAARAIFQPAEEVAKGARFMINHGCLNNVRAIYTLHVDPAWEVGCIGIREGVLTASCDMFKLVLQGKGGHGARPHLAIDPIEAGARWLQAAYLRSSRIINAADTVVISVCKFQSGHSANVIPEFAELEGTIRTLSMTARQQMLVMLDDVTAAIQRETGCKIELTFGMSAPAVQNDPALVEIIRSAGGAMLGAQQVRYVERPSMGSEDFSYYQQQVPGAMLRLGIAGETVGKMPLHNPLFDVDERAICVGVKVLTAAVLLHQRSLIS